MELKQAVELFLGEYQKASTREAYYYVLIDMIDYMGPGRPLTDIGKPNMIQYSQHMETKGWAPATIQKHHKTIKTFFNWLIKLELLEKSPATVLKHKRLPDHVSREKAMSDEEYEQILKYAKWKPRDHALVLFLGDTGCRIGGAAGLQEQHLDLDQCSGVVTEKGDKKRPVAYGSACAQALRKWLIRRKSGGPNKYVFSHSGKKMNADSLSQVVRRACLKVGIRSLGAHSLRHRKGHQLADDKVAPSVAATALGHEDPNITLTYYYPRDWARAEAALRKLAQPSEQPTKVVKFPLENRN